MTAHRQYWVDWEDNDYPAIRVWHPHSDAAPLTITEAKQEIIERLQNDIDDIRAVVRNIRSLKASDIKEEE